MFNVFYKNIQITKHFHKGIALLEMLHKFKSNNLFSSVFAKVNDLSQGLKFRAFGKRRWLFVLLMSMVICHGLNAQNTNGLRYFNLVLPDNSLVSYELVDGIDIQFQDSLIVVNGLNYPMEDIVKYYFSINQYFSLIVAANLAEGGTVGGGGHFLSGETCTITATPNPGYIFLNWTENGTQISTNANYTFTVTGNRNLVANFQPLPSYSYHINNIVRIDRTNCSSLTQLSVLIPFPMTNQYQTISDETYIGGQLLSIPNTPNKYVRFLYTSEQLSNLGNVFDATISFDAILHSYVFDFSQISTIYPYNTSNPEYQQNIGASDVYIVPDNPTINTIAQNIWSVSSDIVDYARRCYEYVAQNYSYLNPMTGLHPLAELLANGGGDCGNLSSIYISLLRNKSIPSRHVVTIRPDGSCHVWAEFYLENYGWIPVDVTAKQGNPNGDYFGIYDGNGIVVSKGICLELERTPGDSYQCVLLQNYDWWFWNNNTSLCNEIITQHIVNNEQQYSICVSANPSDGGYVTGEGMYNHGASCILTATPAEGYSFIGWTKNGAIVSTNTTYSFIVTENAEYVANFSSSTWGGDIVEIGDGTSTTYVTPFNSLWGYSFVEQIYTADEIGASGTITAISFNLREIDAAQTNEVEIFMKNVSRTEFSSNTDYESVTASDMVFSGMVTFGPGWTTITLDTPFEYDISSNLLIGMHEFTQGYSTRYFYYTTASNKVLSYHSDSANPDPYDLGSYSGSKYVSPNRANLRIGISNSTEILTVYDGSATNDYVPVYGLFCDAYLKCEYVMPATELAEMVGSNISAMTYYLSIPASDSWGDAHFQVFMKEVDFTSIDIYQGMDGATLVYEGPLDGTQTEMDVFFSTPYHYNGGNLLIGIYNTIEGSYENVSYYGKTVNGASVQGYSYNSLEEVTCNQRDFLPKTTFHYHLPNSYQQSIALQAGWNWFSTHLDITLNDLKTALVEALPNTSITIYSQSDGSTTYIGSRWRGTLNVLDVSQMYMIQTGSSCQITLTGSPINPAEHPVTIHSGANWMAFPFSENMTLNNAFAGFATNGDMVISQFGTAAYFNGTWRGNCSILEPGKGYIYKSNVQSDRTFTFPISTK